MFTNILPYHVVHTSLKESDLVSERAAHMAPPHISQSALAAWSVLYGVIWQIPWDTESIKRTHDDTRLLVYEAIVRLTKWTCPLSSQVGKCTRRLICMPYEYAYFGSKSVTHLRPDLHQQSTSWALRTTGTEKQQHTEQLYPADRDVAMVDMRRNSNQLFRR